MDWIAAKSYYLGYNHIDRFYSIVFIHNYLLTWSIGIFISLILPLLFIFAPSTLHTTRTSHFLIICFVCLANMFCLYNQAYMLTGPSEPLLSTHPCRFIVYISTFAKPIGIYLTLFFSIERLFTKIISKFFILSHKYRQLFQRLYTLVIFLGTISILSIRLYQVLKYIPRNQSLTNRTTDTDDVRHDDIIDTRFNSTDRNVSFNYCFNFMNIDTYAKILTFYVMQYWYEYMFISIITLILLTIIIQQWRLSRTRQSRFSVNTKLYISLSFSVILTEFLLLFLHYIVDDPNNNNSNVQLKALEIMLFTFNFRCIFLPIIVCITTCESLKQFFYELIITRPYLDNIDENDAANQTEPFTSSQGINNRIQDKFRRTFTKNNTNNNNKEQLNDDDDLQGDL